MRLNTCAQLFRRNGQNAISIDLKHHLNFCRTGDHRWNTPQLELSKASAIRHQFSFTLHNMDQHCRLTIFIGRKLLRLGHRNRRVACNDFLDQTAHGFEPERQRQHVKQQHLIVGFVTHQNIRLNRSTNGDHAVRIDVA